MSADSSKQTWQAGRDWPEVFKVMKSKDLQPRLLYPAKLSFRMEGKIKVLPREGKTKEVIHHKAILKKILFFISRERGREGERDRNINVWLPLACPLLEDLAHNPCALTGN